MSAWICSEKHIELLAVSYFRQKRMIDTKNIVDIAKVLWKENHKSINYRYNERTRTPIIKEKPVDYYDNLLVHYSKMDIYKLAQSYDYQSCEHDGYEKSKAKGIINSILLCTSGDIIGGLSGYDTAHWAI